ncbi:MAG: hypothetical protein ACE5H2_07575 [Terriglobia bacterium]
MQHNQSFIIADGRAVAMPSKRLLARGVLSAPPVELSAELLKKIEVSGRTDAERGVARLTLRRRGERYRVQVYLYYDAAQAALRLISVQHG